MEIAPIQGEIQIHSPRFKQIKEDTLGVGWIKIDNHLSQPPSQLCGRTGMAFFIVSSVIVEIHLSEVSKILP